MYASLDLGLGNHVGQDTRHGPKSGAGFRPTANNRRLAKHMAAIQSNIVCASELIIF
jgi:hypothetical protein